MQDKQFEELLFLLCVDRVEKFRSAYNLIKVLSWKYEIWRFSDVSKRLKDQHFITEEIVGRMNYYSITDAGKQYLLGSRDVFKDELMSRFPREVQFSTELLNGW